MPLLSQKENPAWHKITNANNCYDKLKSSVQILGQTDTIKSKKYLTSNFSIIHNTN
jgi:hypothetical protein